MPAERAVVVDRDALLLARVAGELGAAGMQVETLASTLGLTPDLIDLSAPNLLIVDAGLPGMDRSALLVLVRSLKSRRRLRVVVSADDDVAALRRQIDADLVVDRAELVAQGAECLGVTLSATTKLDLRGLLDEVLGGRPTAGPRGLEAKVDLFSKTNFYAAPDGKVQGVFFATAVLEPVGQKVRVRLDLSGRASFELDGEVAWQRSHQSFGGRVSTGFGVRLVDLPGEAAQAIARFAELREPMFWTG